jgi:short-subunit dehydrogenase
MGGETIDNRQRYGGWALVVGGSQGLGKSIAVEAARRGMNVAIVARRPDVLHIAAREVAAQFGVQTRAIVADAGDPDIVAIVEDAMAGDPVGLLVYNAAAEPHGEFVEQHIDEHRYNIAVNVTGPTLLVHHFGRAMAARGKGGIVLCSSLAACQGIYSWAGYGAAKAYAMILGEGLWEELGDRGVNACTLMIGSTYTPNFFGTQQRKRSIFAESRQPADLPDGVAIPQLPDEAAAQLFAQLDGDWLPLIYANPADEARAAQLAKLPRVDLIRRMGAAMRSGFRAEMR